MDGLRAGLPCIWGGGVCVWSQISMGRFGCWVIRTQHSRLLSYVSPKPGVLGNPSLMPIVGVRGFRLSLGGKDLTAAGSQGP